MISYKDKVKLILVDADGYNDKTVVLNQTVKSLFHLGGSYSQSASAEEHAADAHVYLNPKDPIVLANAYRLEGMYIVANMFGGDESDAWYRIGSVVVGQRKLLANNVDNVHCFLNKVHALADLPEPEES